MKQLCILLCALGILTHLSAQDQKDLSPIIFIYDASGSMWGKLEGKTKMSIAAEVLTEAVNKLPDGQQIGLVAYGHREKENCEDVEFLVDTEKGTKAKVNEAIKGIKPLGKTPLAFSAKQVIGKLRGAKMKATVILITDGIESCDGDICEVIKAAKAEGVDFRLHIIGFGLKEGETEQLICAAQAGEGQYYDAANAGGLSEVLNEATSTTVDDPANNISVFAVKNGEPIDAYVKARKSGTGKGRSTARTYRDTVFFHLAPGIYDLEVLPLENVSILPITLKDVEVKSGEVVHRDVSFDGGKINLTTTNNGEGWDCTVKILDAATQKRVSAGRTYGRTKTFEVNPGTYDIQLGALQIKGLETVHTIEGIQVAGGGTHEAKHDFKSGIAMIGAKTPSELVDATVNIKEVNSGKSVVGGRTYTSASNNPKKFILNPGTYEVTLRTLGKHKGQTKTFTIEVKAGDTVEKITTF